MAAAAPLGVPSGKTGHHPGWKPLQGSASDRIPGWAPSPCRLPGPVTRYETCLRRVLMAATVSSTPFRAPVSVCGAGCAGRSRGEVRAGQSESGHLGVNTLGLWGLLSFLKAKVCKSCGMCTCSGQSSWVRGISLSLGSSQSRARGAPGVMARGIPDAISVRPALGPGGDGWRWAAHMDAGRRLRLRSMGGGGARAYHFLRSLTSS